jgi:DNA-binding transcriptional ArsR family regulator
VPGPPGRPRKKAAAVAERSHADRFAALADPTRRHLLEGLATADRTVSELVSGLDMSQAAVSQHLRVLREAGLVTAERDGRHRRYRLLPSALTELRDWLDELERFWRQRLTALGDYLDAGGPDTGFSDTGFSATGFSATGQPDGTSRGEADG